MAGAGGEPISVISAAGQVTRYRGLPFLAPGTKMAIRKQVIHEAIQKQHGR